MRIEKHPEKAELIQALTKRDKRVAAHLASCHHCRELADILKWSGAEQGRLLWQPPEELVRKLQAVPQLVESRRPARMTRALPVTDTWADWPALAVRESAFGVERRVRFEAGEFALEFVAARRLNGWECVARAYRGDSPVHDFVLKAGTRKLLPGEGGCFIWNTTNPPRRLALLSPELKIDLERLEW